MPSTLMNTEPWRFSPAGLMDTLDETDFPGACAVLTNLIPDPTTKNSWVCRPAATLLTNFSALTSPGFISVFKVVGNFVYGMISSGLNSGKDQPFCFDLLNNINVPVSGITSSNVPTSPPTSGAWTPPTMDVCGVNLVVTHPGFDGVTNFFGWFNISNPGSPIWNAGNIQSTGTINSFGAISAGSGGTNGTYNNVALSGGTGFAAIANIVVSGNAVTSVTIVSGGLGYLVGDVLSAPPATIGGVTGFSVPVASLQPSAIVLTTVPSWVVQYNGRACFGINPPTGLPSMVMTNSLSLGVTNANQALTFGDNTILVGAAGMPLNNQLGGIIASIMVFKDDSNIAQITGDFSTSNLAINTLNVAIGTIGIRSVSKSPKGLVFCAADGIRYIDQNAQVSDPIGVAGSGVNVPFRYALNTSRMAASCNATVFRISIQSGTFAGNPWIEYWFDIPRQQWSGPHTFPAACIDVYDNNFIMSAVGINAALFTSNPIPNNLSMYTENSVALQFVFQTAMLRDPIKIASYRISELIVKLGYDNNSLTMNIAQLNENNSVLNSTIVSFPSLPTAIWGTSQWGNTLWGGGVEVLFPMRVDWPPDTTYYRCALKINGASSGGVRIKDILIRNEELDYLCVKPLP